LSKEAIAKYKALLYERGLASALSGNVSLRAERFVYISPTQIPSYRLRPQDVSVVTVTGEYVEGKPPSSELLIHLALYNVTEHKAVVHAHSRFATAFACSGKELELRDVEGKELLGRIPSIPYAEPGTPGLAAAVAEGIQEFKGALLENHGLIAVGTDLEQAFIVAEAIERASQLAFDLTILTRQ
jgi:L-fuculose-phosphate aldolase